MKLPLLSRINSPVDLKRLTLAQRQQLAAEIRHKIIEVVSRTGGHLGPSLGAVELAIGLHTVFHSPVDRIIWDVGHQAYAHKLLTGRKDLFHTIRQTGGLSGFPRRTESEHDAFGTAHASTALSAALGYAKARDLRGEKYEVIAVVGDGALTGGMAYEALNNIGHDSTDLIVVLNDNSMSIAPNVGAIATYLRRLRSDPTYRRLRQDLDRLIKRIPAIGGKVAGTIDRLREGIKHALIPGQIFEELGFTYIGPIDGHDLKTVEETLRQAQNIPGPVLIHAVTVKGKGYRPAEGDPYVFHGTGPFEVATGKGIGKPSATPSYSTVFARTLIKLAEQDPRIVGITAAMPDGTGLESFRKVFPHRFFDVGIAEQHAVTFAAGLACGGMRPVVAIYSTFLQRAYDQIIHDVAIQKLPVTFCIDRAGIVGADGETHQGAFDLAYLRCIPNMVVSAAADENELQNLMATAVNHDGPFAVRYPRGSGIGAEQDAVPTPLPIGKGELLRQGQDVALIGVGPLVYRALAAAEQLEAEGIDAAVVNARYIKPLDEELLLDVLSRVPAAVLFEEGTVHGGFSSAVLELCADRGISGVVYARLGLPDYFVPHGDPEHFRSQFELTAEGIYRAARRVIGLAAKTA